MASPIRTMSPTGTLTGNRRKRRRCYPSTTSARRAVAMAIRIKKRIGNLAACTPPRLATSSRSVEAQHVQHVVMPRRAALRPERGLHRAAREEPPVGRDVA